jgi:hypothetical protein
MFMVVAAVLTAYGNFTGVKQVILITLEMVNMKSTQVDVLLVNKKVIV